MSGHKPFKNLSDRLRSTPEGRALTDQEARILRDVIQLPQLRGARGMTQSQLAEAWQVSQENVSRVERQNDVYLSTLARYVAALGGRLEIAAVFPDQTVTFTAMPECEGTAGTAVP